MSDIEIVQHMAGGLTVKEIAVKCKVKFKDVENRIVKMKGLYFALTAAHLVAIFMRKKLIE